MKPGETVLFHLSLLFNHWISYVQKLAFFLIFEVEIPPFLHWISENSFFYIACLLGSKERLLKLALSPNYWLVLCTYVRVCNLRHRLFLFILGMTIWNDEDMFPGNVAALEISRSRSSKFLLALIT